MSQPEPPVSGMEILVRSGADFGRAIGNIRRAREMTQSEFAEASGLTREYLAQIEAGRTNPLIELVLQVLRRNGAQIVIQWRR